MLLIIFILDINLVMNVDVIWKSFTSEKKRAIGTIDSRASVLFLTLRMFFMSIIYKLFL